MKMMIRKTNYTEKESLKRKGFPLKAGKKSFSELELDFVILHVLHEKVSHSK